MNAPLCLQRSIFSRRPLRDWLAGLLCGGVLWLGATHGVSLPARAAEPAAQGLEFFEKKIRPVLVQHCYECHSADRDAAKGGLQLDTRQGIRTGGDSGPAVVPHKADESLLLSALRQESFEMPPAGKLPDAVIADFERWIADGAPDPREGDAPLARQHVDLAGARDFWSFRPLAKAPPPEADGDWARTAIDRFVFARLREEGLTPAPDADRATLIRRLYFDLIGLPPSPQAIDAFLRDRSPGALEQVVDRLLGMPQFGERWGRHWLDVVRYADSSGGGRTRVFQESWRYRDYVLDAFNADRPYSEFLSEQVAGDLMPSRSVSERARRLTATGFLVLGPTNYELQDKELLRMEVVDEQIDTIGRAFLGITIGCARCHDHKFDPVPTDDYYALAGIFRSTKTLTPGNVSGFVQTPLPLPGEQQQARRRYEQQARPIETQLAEMRKRLKELQDRLTGGRGEVDPATLPGIVVDETDATLEGDWKASSSVKPFVGASYHYAGAGPAKARYEANLPEAGRYEVRVSYTANPNRASNVPVTIEHAGGIAERAVNHRQTPGLDGLFVSLGTFPFEAGRAKVVVGCEGLDGLAIADAVQWLPLDSAAPPAGDAKTEPSREMAAQLRRQIADSQGTIRRLERSLRELQASAPPEAPLVMSVRDEEQPEDYFVCIRGNIRNAGPQVPRGFLRVVGEPVKSPIPNDRSGRLELARWLTSPDNPLTHRVFVNRVWHHLLGEGLVRTPDNFGTMGRPPSHPELLDHLAAGFVRDGWSVKRLIRRIVLSRVYGLSSRAGSAARRLDPENLWLSHAHHRRLEAESIRDLILSVSGRLDLTYGGSLIPPGTNSEFGFRFPEGRRSVYLPVFRNGLHELFEVFDFADPNLVNGRRNTSTLPTQALYLMNSPFIMQQAERAAQRLLDDADSDDQRIELLYRRALGRTPSAEERSLTLDYLRRELANGDVSEQSARTAWASVCQAMFASLDFRYLK